MSKYSSKCGPNATDNYDDTTTYNYTSGKVYYRSHSIVGTGIVENCSATSSSNYEEPYSIGSGITELADSCLSKGSITSISLPSTLEIIGNSCFRNTRITGISLPASLNKLGHTNFPGTLTSLNIPALIDEFFVDNITDCNSLTSITVDKENKFYKSEDGMLFNYDMTELLFCPNAKTGNVIIPKSVKRIGDYCFYKCKKIKKICIPVSVETIGVHAFANIEIDKLIIPNSVKAVGECCFEYAVIKESFKMSSQIDKFPSCCFYNSNINSFSYNFSTVQELADSSISNIKKDIIPEIASFRNLHHIGYHALNYCNETRIFELFSSLQYIDGDAFDNCHDKMVVRFFSYCPIKVGKTAFNKISDNATLVVPKGTKCIFENTIPWSNFSNIEEWALDKDYDENGDESEVTDEIHSLRLRSVADSKMKADRYFLKEIIDDLSLNFQYVESDEEYKDALALIKYNRSFTPAIIPDLEQTICQNWTNKYKLKLIERAVLINPASPLILTQEVKNTSIQDIETLSLPVLDVTPTLPEPHNASGKIDVFFNEEIQKQVQNNLTLAQQNVKIAVSWFTNYALFKQVKEIAKSGIKVKLITNNDLTNNGGYCLDLNELIEAGVEMSLVEYPHLLHHKFCIIDDSIVINGSYNWTRFSAKNYENITVISGDDAVVLQFSDEFEEILSKAEYKNIDKMPDTVPERPEYDRSAFRQYVTEELDAQARETTDERDKITALQTAVKLNPQYMEKINPSATKQYADAFKVVEESVNIQRSIVSIIEDKPKTTTPVQQKNTTKASQPVSTNAKTSNTSKQVHTNQTTSSTITVQEKKIIQNVKASNLFMVLDVSGSMKSTYQAGHVHAITKKVLATSLAISEDGKVSLWKFNADATFVGDIGLSNMSTIDQVKNPGGNTKLSKFVEKADSSIKDNALVIIFTDDDASSMQSAVEMMKKRPNVFWQIIVYGTHSKIDGAISTAKNTSLVSMDNYSSMSNDEITNILLKDYLNWKKQNS